jgi:hypothetical protein
MPVGGQGGGGDHESGVGGCNHLVQLHDGAAESSGGGDTTGPVSEDGLPPHIAGQGRGEVFAEDLVVCRYCLEEEPRDELFRPCQCTNPVHAGCLRRWLTGAHCACEFDVTLVCSRRCVGARE